MNGFISLFINPAIISLFLGALVGINNLFTLPRNLISLVSLYLIFTIGFKGGACLGVAGLCTPPLLALAGAGVIIGFIQPFINNAILKKTTNLDSETAAVIAAEYGSISIVTFITSLSFLAQQGIHYSNFMMALAGIMEIPAIFTGLLLLQQNKRKTASFVSMSKEILLCPKISAIFVGFGVGLIFKILHYDTASYAIIAPFNAALILFMLDIGAAIGSQKEAIKSFSPNLIAFAILMPIIYGTSGLFIARLLVDDLGSAVLFAMLMASASYIAVPAILRSKAPKALESIYLPLSLGITLPFNVLIGLPYLIYIASRLYAN